LRQKEEGQVNAKKQNGGILPGAKDRTVTKKRNREMEGRASQDSTRGPVEGVLEVKRKGSRGPMVREQISGPGDEGVPFQYPSARGGLGLLRRRTSRRFPRGQNHSWTARKLLVTKWTQREA